MEDIPSELTNNNLEEFLHNDSAFVDYFNTFLSLPCFPERIFYNKENDLLEQFTQQLVKDESDNVQLKYDSSSNNVQISYCVTVLERNKALEWLKKYRLPEFIKSGLYAEYKLSKTLSPAQAMYIDTIKNDLSRATSCEVGEDLERCFKSESSRSPEEDSLSSRHSVSGQIEEIINEYENTNDEKSNKQVLLSSDDSLYTSTTVNNDKIRDIKNVENTATGVKEVNGMKSENPNTFAENFGQCFPSIIVNEIETNSVLSTSDGEEVSESTASATSAEFIETSSRTSSEFSHYVTKETDYDTNVDYSSSDIGGSIVRDDVTCEDVIGDDAMCDDVGDDVIGGNVIDGKVMGDGVISDDLPLVSRHTELHDRNDISSLCHENHALDTKESPLLILVTDNSTDIQEERIDTEKHLKGKIKHCKCFDKSENEVHNEHKDELNLSCKEQTTLPTMGRTDKHSKQSYDSNHCTNLSNAIQNSSADLRVDEDNFQKGLISSSFVSKIPMSAFDLEECSSDEKNTQTELKESSSDTNASLEVKGFTVGTLEVTSLQSDVKIDDGSKITKSMNISINDTNATIGDNRMSQEAKNTATVDNLKTLSPDAKLSKVEGRTSNISDKENEHTYLDRPFIQRTSSLSSIASSDISVERKSSIADHEGNEVLDNEVNLASKEGMDKFKEFLINTKGEALLLFWLQVETWKHLGNTGDKIRLLQEMKEQFLRNGSPLELPEEVRKQAAKCFTADLNETQRIITEPLRCYWCPRFTLHQFKTQTSNKVQHEAMLGQKSWSTDVQPKPGIPSLMYPSRSPHIVRPHSSSPRETLHASSPRATALASDTRKTFHENTPRGSPRANTPRETLDSSTPRATLHSSLSREKEGKLHARSKSAHGRMVTTPCHTNAGKKQLELYATPQPAQFGYQKRPISAFPPCNDQAYLSPVRLVITPRCKPRSRAAWPPRSEESRNTDENFLNNPRDNVLQDSLLDSLMYQNESGCFFKEFVSKQNNDLWLNCLSFWQAVMDYTALFESDTLNPITVSRKAQWIYARFITSGSVCDIKLDWRTQDDIRRRLDPPYEELFDCVEDHVLVCLKEPWDSLCRNQQREYNVIPKKETVRYLEVKLKRTRGRSKNSFMLEELESQDGREQSERGKYSIDEANHPFAVPQDGLSFESVIKDRDELEGFQKYLEKKDPKGVMDLMAWTDMETFQRIPRTIEDKRNKKAKEIRQGYLNSRYFFGPDSPAAKEAQNLILSMNGSPRIKERPSSSVITECQKYVRCRIERRWLALYRASQEYRERQNPKQNVSDVVEDIMLRRRLQRSEAAWRVLNSRWVSSSRDIVALRQTLNNPESCLAFRKFVALKGDTYENDVLFWIEIQKYKDLCHRHASEQSIKKKIQAITECFITSSIPPELQVDIPIEMAEKLMERITSRNQNIGPYLFREVQMTVFRVLFNMWKDFCSFRSSINDENLLKVLEKRLKQHRAEVKAKKEANERKKIARQEAEKKRKEKEEKEKKELKSMEQLMSLMAENASWEQEENDVVLWKYSKHISAVSEPTSRQKKVSTQDDITSFMELANQRSVATKSTNQITNSLRSERNTGKVSKSKHVKSLLADSTYSTHSKNSMKGTNSTTSRIPRITESSRNSRTRDIKRYDIIDKNSSEEMITDDKKQRNVGKNKLLKNRERTKSKKILDQEFLESISNVDRELTTTEAGNKHDRVKSPTIKDSGLKSRRKDSPTMEHTSGLDDISVVVERPGNLRTSVLRRQWNQSHDRTRSPVPLTSQLLKDFTNSPEGAPLDTPLSLTRINKSDDVSVVQSSDVLRKTPQISVSKTLKETNLISWRTKRANLRRNEIEQFVPDVIVN